MRGAGEDVGDVRSVREALGDVRSVREALGDVRSVKEALGGVKSEVGAQRVTGEGRAWLPKERQKVPQLSTVHPPHSCTN